jgi:hypothetical protein
MKYHFFYIPFIFVICFFILFVLFYKSKQSTSTIEKYSNYDLACTTGIFPFSETNVLLQDTYPITKRNGVSKDQGSNIWYHYPIFEVGSYDQITNNIRYSNNPDTGRCMAADMCGTLYKEKKNMPSNYSYPLPPAKVITGDARVNYYNSKINMLPYSQDMPNMLY